MKLWRGIYDQEDNMEFEEDLIQTRSLANNDGLTFNTSKGEVVRLRHVASQAENDLSFDNILSQVSHQLRHECLPSRPYTDNVEANLWSV